MRQSKPLAVARARRRVKALEEQAAPWPWRARAWRQLRKVESGGRKQCPLR